MDCKTVLKNLVAYLDGELDTDMQDTIKQHLATCAACNQEAQLLDRTWNLLTEYPELTPKPQTIEEIKERAQSPKEPKSALLSKRWDWQKIAGLAAAAGLIIALGLYLVIDPFRVSTTHTPTVANGQVNDINKTLLNSYQELLAEFDAVKETDYQIGGELKELSPYVFADEGDL